MKMIYFDFFGVLSTPVYWTVIETFFPESQRDSWFKKLDLLDTGVLSETDLVTDIAEERGVFCDVVWNAVSRAPTLNTELLSYITEHLVTTYRVGLLTNIPRSLLERLLEDQLQLFNPALVSSDVGLVKPNPEIFQLAISRAGRDPDQIVFIDDSEKNVFEARRQGINSIVYVDNESLVSQLQTLGRQPP